jgi:ribonuclease VapC
MIVFDASAVLAVLLDEPGADVVIDNMQAAHISTVNLSEVFTKTIEQGGSLERTQARIDSFGLRIRKFGEHHALAAAKLRPLTKHLGLSAGDRACLALGQCTLLPVLTADRQWADLDLGIDVRMIR